MVFSALVQAANKLAATILPSNATPIPPVQQAFTLADTEGSRARLQGAIARAPGLLGAHVYYLIPDALSLLTARSKSLSLSDDGDATSASDRSEAAFLALNITDVAYGIVRASAKPGDLPFTVGGTSHGAIVTIDPVIGTPFSSLQVTIGVGAPQVLSIAQAVGLVAAQWIPWAGTPGAPPAIPIQAGIPTAAAADATTIDQTTFLGDATGPARAMREASLNLVLTGLPTTCAHTASFVAGIIDQNIGRPLSVALASIQPPANAADGWAWFKANVDALATRTPPTDRGDLAGIGTRFCSKGDRDDYAKFFQGRIDSMTGGPRTMAQTLEQVDACRILVQQQRRKADKYFSTRSGEKS